MSAVLPSSASFPQLPTRGGEETGHAKPQAPKPTTAPSTAAASPSIALLRSAPPAHEPAAAGRRQGLILVVLLHLLLGWALASGLAKQAVEIIKKPIEMAVIQENLPPPPPPPKIERIKEIPKAEVPPPPAYVPPPEVLPAVTPPPVLSQVQAEPPKQAVEIAPPPPPAPPVQAAPEPKPIVKQDITAACPGYQTLLSQTLEDAFDRVGIPGTVRTLIKLRGSQIIDVQAQSGPKEYHKFLQTALKRLRCNASGADEVHISLDVNFRR